MGKASKKDRRRALACAVEPSGPGSPPRSTTEAGPTVPINLAAYAHAAALTGAKKIKKKCCRSTPRCKGCPVMVMRAARLQEAGVTGKDFKKAMKKARAA